MCWGPFSSRMFKMAWTKGTAEPCTILNSIQFKSILLFFSSVQAFIPIRSIQLYQSFKQFYCIKASICVKSLWKSVNSSRAYCIWRLQLILSSIGSRFINPQRRRRRRTQCKRIVLYFCCLDFCIRWQKSRKQIKERVSSLPQCFAHI